MLLPAVHTLAPALPLAGLALPLAPAAPSLAPATLLASAGSLADPVSTAFELVTFLPQPVWLLLVFLPNWKGTRALMEPIAPLAALALAHLVIVGFGVAHPFPEPGTAPLDLFNRLFDPSEPDGLGVYLELGTYRNFAAEEWTHVLVWDLFVGRYIWLDGRRRSIFTGHSVLLTNFIGPPGLLLHLLTCAVLGKGLPTEDASRPEDTE